ncbi:aspartate/glutamate racemase family protein [Salmonella enterica]|uniref:Aspartate racemase n=1 Tax=Salmonella newport TaxID=108619 RepID=A0A5U9KSN2_SALNE|nr:aspartate racemase [Salmonella enterica subsp. enterica serovar Newport]EBP1503529.1 aspartate racemase [Salmonella enterica]ECD7244757.1 aspartate racemase [Salmonella enterica subsp. enterica serovar Florida]EDW1732890.1 aspartate racemase [Salmonella enterica subsp. enterica]EHJ5405803.1 aspartate/glutamate racemase family protein [Salmonella enterica subsp. enterica serovar Wedding]
MTVSIGVLAGMGPRSTAPFIDMLVTDCQTEYGARYDMDFPEMHIISLPTPFWPGQKIDDKAMVAILKQGIDKLVRAKVSLIAIPCNLAHCYFTEMKEVSAGIPLLHIADSALESLPSEATKVAVLATEPTLDAGFYQARIKASGKVIIDSRKLRDMTTSLIGLVKTAGFHAPDVRLAWQNLMLVIESNKVEALLIACTDLSPLIINNSFSFIIVDTAASLSRSTIKNFMRLSDGDNICQNVPSGNGEYPGGGAIRTMLF